MFNLAIYIIKCLSTVLIFSLSVKKSKGNTIIHNPDCVFLSLCGLCYFYHSFSFLRTFSHFFITLPGLQKYICFSYIDFPGLLYLFGYFNHKSLLFKMCLLLSLRCVIFSVCVCMCGIRMYACLCSPMLVVYLNSLFFETISHFT